jgi:hypothetical protein
MNLETCLTNPRRISAADGFPSDSQTQVVESVSAENSIARQADATSWHHGTRPMDAKFLHPVNQRGSLHS